MGTYSGKVNASKVFRRQGDGNLSGNQVGTQTGTFLYDERNSIIHTYTRPFLLWPRLGLGRFSGSHLPTFAPLAGEPGRVLATNLAHGPGRRMPGALPDAGAGHMRTDTEMSAGAASLATLTGRAVIGWRWLWVVHACALSCPFRPWPGAYLVLGTTCEQLLK